MVGGTENLEPSEQKVLGLKWNYESDELLLTFDKLIELSKTMTPTKRNLLKLSASLFDPLGIVSPVSVRMKILLQETCKLHLEWDTPLPETLVKVWCEILNDFEQILCISIPRCYFDEITEEIEQYSLHAFGDASKKAFCSVIYLVMKIASGYHCKLVTSKSRVVPLKEMSVPRLELIAALILARLLNNVKHSLESQILFESIYCWSDSTIVLSWLKNDRNYKQFVSNRTKNILKLTSPEMWNHCSTEDNPADIGTKGKSAAELKNSSLWWAGPEWLKGSPESYPPQLAPQELESDECLKEVCKEQITLQVSANKFNHMRVNLDEVIYVDR